MKELLKRIIKKSPIALSKNHRYDLLTKKIIQLLPIDANTIDVGCHKGEILDLIIHSSPQGKHFGIEPIPLLYDELNKKYSSNSNCTISRFAASDTNGEVIFNYVISNPAYSGILKRDYDNPNEKDTKIRVRTRKLDDQISDKIKIDLIKIDVEGAELQVLKGASKIIKRDQPIVIFEHGIGGSDHYGTTPEKVFAFFEECNMKIYNLHSFIHQKNSLDFEEFKNQFYLKKNYYFVAHT